MLFELKNRHNHFDDNINNYSKYINIWSITIINRKVSLLHKSMKHEKKNVR